MLGVECGHVHRPAPPLIGIDAELNLDHHAGDGVVIAIMQHHDAIGPVFRRDHLRQIGRPLFGAMMLEPKVGAQIEKRRRQLIACTEQLDEHLMGERRHSALR